MSQERPADVVFYRRWILANGWAEAAGLGTTLALGWVIAPFLADVPGVATIFGGVLAAVALGTLLEGGDRRGRDPRQVPAPVPRRTAPHRTGRVIQRIAIFGATGRTGERLVAEAFARGWQARALCRPGRGAAPGEPGLDVIHGQLTDPVALDQTLSGCDAACCVFGPRPPYTDLFCADVMRAIIAAATRARVPRLICQTGAMIGPYPANRTLPFDLMARLLARQLPAAAADRWQQETAVQNSHLEWTVIKPPRLTDGPAGRPVRAGLHARVGLTSRISRADLAQFFVRELAEPRFTHQTIFVSA